MSDRARIEELTAMVASGAATDEERAELDAIIAADPSVAAELAELEEAAAALALALEPVAPPEGALDGIVSKLSARPKGTIAGPAPAPTPVEPKPKTGPGEAAKGEGADIISLAARRKQRAYAGIAALAIAAAAAFAFLWLRDRKQLETDLAAKDDLLEKVKRDAQSEIDDLGRKLEAAGQEAKTLRARFAPLEGTDLALSRLTNDKEGGVANVIADKTGRRWLVIAVELPEIRADQDYQLWFVPEGGEPISAGLLRPGPDGVRAATPTLPPEVATGTKVIPAISLEPKGGSPKPTVVKMMGSAI